MQLNYKSAGAEDSEIVADLVAALISELRGTPVEPEGYVQSAKRLLSGGKPYTALLACSPSDEVLGFISVYESSSIHTNGDYGVIQELFVFPAYRSSRVGQGLLAQVKELAQAKGWTRLEVGAPDAERWQRTIDFYKREGFGEIGPRLKWMAGQA